MFVRVGGRKEDKRKSGFREPYELDVGFLRGGLWAAVILAVLGWQGMV